jgi:hypothetical protein
VIVDKVGVWGPVSKGYSRRNDGGRSREYPLIDPAIWSRTSPILFLPDLINFAVTCWPDRQLIVDRLQDER